MNENVKEKTQPTAPEMTKEELQEALEKGVYFPNLFYKVHIPPKNNKDEINDIPLSPEGRTLLVQRGATVILRGDYLDVLKNAKYDVTRRSIEDGLIEGEEVVQMYSYSVLGYSTAKEYLKMLKEGTIVYKKAHGYE